ncbi:MAG: general secretion pathway protein GspB, partial [Colwellia sp.]
LLCHSALMLAYNQNDSVVNKKTVIAAATRALGEDVTSKKGRVHYNGVLIFSTALSVAAFLALAGFWWGQTQASVRDIAVNSSQENVISTVNTKEQLKGSELAKVVVEMSEDKPRSDDSNTQSEQTKVNTNTNTNADTAKASIARSPQNTALVVAKKPSKISSKSLSNKSPAVEKPPSEHINEPVNDKALLVGAKKNNLSHDKNNNINYKVTEVEGVSSDLLARFQAAIDETSVEKSPSSQSNYHLEGSGNTYDSLLSANNETAIRPLTQMSQQLQNALPSLQFEQHIYASDGQGWVNVNGRDRYEGDYIGDNLIVEKILPQQVILSFQGEKFSLPALTNW